MIRAAVLCSIVIAAGVARADQEHARQLYTEGNAAYMGGRFGDAARLYEAAYAEAPSTPLLWNIAQAYREQYEVDRDVTNLRRAKVVFQHYSELSTKPEDKKEGMDAEAAVGAQIAAIEAATPKPPASPKRVEPAPLRTNELPSRAPPPTVAAPAAAPVVAVHAARPRRNLTRIVGLSLVGGGAVLAGVGLALGLAAHSDATSVQSAGSPAAPVPYGQVADEAAQGHALQTASFSLYGIAAAVAVTGVILAALPSRRAQ